VSTANGIAFDRLCRVNGIAVPVAEYKFALSLGRDFRFDWAWPDYLVALEVEGGMFARGRHVQAAGVRRDMDKYNSAILLGWAVLRCLPEQLTTTALDLARTALARRRVQWATLTAPHDGWICLWATREDAEAGRDVDERVGRVRVEVLD